jgi:NAD(P)-dependent dehydrogenase (short-subunit alcohol dehydrogenase family)
MGRLDGKTVLLTGAGGGIGRSICERMLSEGAGVAATDVDFDAAQLAIAGHADTGKATALWCDAGDSASVHAAVEEAVSTFGSLTTLCNVAGGSTSRDGRVTEAPEDEFWRVLRIDLFGTFLACKHGLPQLIKAGGGSVINMTSMAALLAIPDRDCYTAAKGGVAAMTRSMAAGYARHSIRVNAIAPGITMTPRVRAHLESSPGVAELAGRHLLGTVEAADVANMAVFLASDESRVVTGQVISVDSGVTIH